MGDESCVALATRDLGEVARRKGNYEEARQYLCQSLRNFEKLGHNESTIMVIGRFAELAESTGDGERTARLLGFSIAQSKDSIHTLSPFLRDEQEKRNKLMIPTRKLLGDQSFEQFFTERTAMSLQEVTAYALEDI